MARENKFRKAYDSNKTATDDFVEALYALEDGEKEKKPVEIEEKPPVVAEKTTEKTDEKKVEQAKPATDKEEKAVEKASYIRHTFYVTEEIVEAIKELAYRESKVRKKGTSQTFQSDIVREVFEAGLEQRCPGIMKEMAELIKARNSHE